MTSESSYLSPWLCSKIFNPELDAKSESKTYEEAEATENVIMLNDVFPGQPL